MSDSQADILREVFIAAAPATVFEHLVAPAAMARWIGLAHRIEPRPGGEFRVEISRGNIARGIYTRVQPPHSVAFTFGWETHEADLGKLAGLPPGSSLVEFELEAKDGGTLVRLRHSRLPESTIEMHGERWSHHLALLAATVEGAARVRTSEKKSQGETA